MSWLKNSLKNKLVTFTGILVLLVIVIGIIGWLSTLQMQESVKVIDIANGIKIDILEARREEKNLIIRGFVQEHCDKWEKAMSRFSSKVEDLRNYESITIEEKKELEKGASDFENIFKNFIKDLRIGPMTKLQIDDYDNKFKIFGRKAIEIIDNVINNTQSRVKSIENRTLVIIYGIALFAVIIGIIISIYFVRIFIKPLKDLIDMVMQVFTIKIEKLELDSKDEVGKIKSILVEISDKQQKLCGSLLENCELINKASLNLMSMSEQTVFAIEQLSSRTSSAAASSDEIASNVNSVSSASEEMTSSIKEIAKNTSLSSKITEEAKSKANNANEVMRRLGESSTEIGNIIKVITTIAEQTNLLALNATIEAARAGESGKGFAVVANEVKDLAKESAKATEDIIERVKVMQEDSSNAINAISEIIETMRKINDVTNTVASAVEEQSVTVNEVNKNIAGASTGISSIAAINSGISTSVHEYSVLVNKIKECAKEVENLSVCTINDIKKRFNVDHLGKK